MPLGKNNTDLNSTGTSYKNGTPITTPVNFGTPVTPPVDFGNPIPSSGTNENAVDWVPSPEHFGNIIGGSTPVQPTPTFDPAGGAYSGTQSVTIASADADQIFYTTDGSTPTRGSNLYSGPVSVATSETLKALAVRAGYQDSAIGTAAYVIGSHPVVVQSAFTFGNTDSLDITLGSPVLVGCVVFIQANDSAAVVTSVVADSGDAFTLVSGPDTSATDGARRWVYFLHLHLSSFTKVTVTFDSGHLCAGTAVESNGRTDANTYLTHPTQTGWDDGGTVTTADNDLLLSFMSYFDDADSATFTAGMGWTEVLAEYSTFERNQGILVQSQAVGAAGTNDATATTSGAVGGGMETLALRN